MTNWNGSVLYTGVTSDLSRRVFEHRRHIYRGFSHNYNVTKLVYYEVFEDISAAIQREKQIKGGSRQKKLDLINRKNPLWLELKP